MYLNRTSFRYILGTRVDATHYNDATQLVLAWSKRQQSRYVCAANVHMVMEGYDDLHFQRIVNSADLVTSDGMPLVWALKRLGVDDATRVYGPDLMMTVCEAAERLGIPIGFYGGKGEYLGTLRETVLQHFPQLKIVFSYSPPFRQLDPVEDERITQQINASGARILFVGLGCPKQEVWMLEHKGRVHTVMLGVGAAFDFYSGRIKQAPKWVQRMGMEWAFRLGQDPIRLWRRYFKHNPRFMLFFAMQLLGKRHFSNGKKLLPPIVRSKK